MTPDDIAWVRGRAETSLSGQAARARRQKIISFATKVHCNATWSVL